MLAFLRSLSAVPPLTLEDLRPPAGGPPLALRCTRPGCTSCAAFETEGQQQFEATLGPYEIVDWRCDTRQRRALAVSAGVTMLPSYIFLPSRPEVSYRVVRPDE